MKKLIALIALIIPTLGLAQTQEDIWQFSHSVAIPSVDTPWLASGCYVYPHSAASSQAYVVPNCSGTTAQSYNWNHGTIAPYFQDGSFVTDDYGTEDLGDLGLIDPSIPTTSGSCGTQARYNQYADIDGDGVNERIIQVYGCFSDSGAIDSYVLDHDGTNWNSTHYPNSLMFAADIDNSGTLELVDLMNDFGGDYIGDGYFKYLDIDNNGYRDFIFLADHDTEWGIWLNYGTHFTRLPGSIVNTSGRYSQFPDYDGDGDHDLVTYENGQLNFYQNTYASQGTWVTTGAAFGDEVIINGQVVVWHPEDRSSRALRVGDPILIAGVNPNVQVIAKETPSLADGTGGNTGGNGGGGSGGGAGTGGGSGGARTGLAYFSDDPSCVTGNSTHWQCGQKDWADYSTLSNHLFIATCPTDGVCYGDGAWVAVADLLDSDYVRMCSGTPTSSYIYDCNPQSFQQGVGGTVPPEPEPDPVPVHVFVGTVEDWILCPAGVCDEVNLYTSEAAVKAAAEALPDNQANSWYKRTLELYDLEWQ